MRSTTHTSTDNGIGTALTLAMAIACGVSVANIYYNQPLLGLLESAFPADLTAIGLVPTITQLGYAAGLILLVPLGDRVERRRLILVQFAALTFALVLLSIAPQPWALVTASGLVGFTASVAQQIVPFAAELAQPQRRGRVVGSVMSGVLCGILIGRAIGGAVGDYFGWRATFALGAMLSGLVGILLALVLPRSVPTNSSTYPELLRSLFVLVREEPALRRATAIQSTMFASFIGLWTILALRLADQFQFGAAVAGLFGLVGAVGILIAPLAGHISDRRGPYAVIGLGTAIMLVSWIVFGLWESMTGLIVGVILLDFGEQSSLIANQHIIYALRPEARSRSNTVFVGGMFIGGALGSAGANLCWHWGGWPAACAFGCGLVVIGLALHIAQRIRAS